MIAYLFILLLNLNGHTKVDSNWTEEWKNVSTQTVNQLQGSLNSDKWHIRSAALLQLEKIDLNHAVRASRQMITDPALMVRAQAAKILAKSKDPQDTRLLMEQLYSEQNFHKGQSLFIRREIIKSLPIESLQKDKFILSKLIQDRDLSIKQYINAKLNRRGNE
jgi:hypothetical protein